MNARRLTKAATMAAALSLGLGLAGNGKTARASHRRHVRIAAATPWGSFDYRRGHGTTIAVRPAKRICEERPRQVWREPEYELREVWVEVPAVIETREVPRYGAYGRVIGYEYEDVVIEPARRVLRTQRVLVRPGYYETVYEQVCYRRGAVRGGVGFGYRPYARSAAPAVVRIGRARPHPPVTRIRAARRLTRHGMRVRFDLRR